MALVRQERPDIASALLHLGAITIDDRTERQASWGLYNQGRREMLINPRITDVYDLAALLLHEGQHCLDDQQGILSPFGSHVDSEMRAYDTEFTWWQKHFPYGRWDTAHGRDQTFFYRMWKNDYLRAYLTVNEAIG